MWRLPQKTDGDLWSLETHIGEIIAFAFAFLVLFIAWLPQRDKTKGDDRMICKRCGKEAPQTLIKSWEMKGRRPKVGKAKTIVLTVYECTLCGKRWREGKVKEDWEAMKPCPIKACKHQWKTEEGLLYHLYQRHRKFDIIKALWELMRKHEV
jgi:hypothetical protein